MLPAGSRAPRPDRVLLLLARVRGQPVQQRLPLRRRLLLPLRRTLLSLISGLLVGRLTLGELALVLLPERLAAEARRLRLPLLALAGWLGILLRHLVLVLRVVPVPRDPPVLVALRSTGTHGSAGLGEVLPLLLGHLRRLGRGGLGERAADWVLAVRDALGAAVDDL